MDFGEAYNQLVRPLEVLSLEAQLKSMEEKMVAARDSRQLHAENPESSRADFAEREERRLNMIKLIWKLLSGKNTRH